METISKLLVTFMNGVSREFDEVIFNNYLDNDFNECELLINGKTVEIRSCEDIANIQTISKPLTTTN